MVMKIRCWHRRKTKPKKKPLSTIKKMEMCPWTFHKVYALSWMNSVFLTLVICSSNALSLSSAWIKSVVLSPAVITSSMICTPFLWIWSMHAFFILSANAKPMITSRLCWSCQNIICWMFIVLFPSLLQNRILSRANYTGIQTLFTQEIKRFYTIIVQTFILRLRKKNTDPTRS